MTPTHGVLPDKYSVEEVDDPDLAARFAASHERAARNARWLSEHWADLLPQARGKYVAVVDEQAFVADTAEAAWAWCRPAGPDAGALVQYVRPTSGPRVYGHLRLVAGDDRRDDPADSRR